MTDEHKTKEQLIGELAELRGQVAALEALEVNRQQAKDMTEYRQAEESLRESEEKYRALVEQSLQGLVIIQDFRIAFANPAFAEMSGYTVEELLSLGAEDVMASIHPEDRVLVWAHFKARLLEEPVDPRYEYRAIRKDGTVRWLDMSASRIEYDGRPAIQAAMVDVTERKRAERALRESEERYRNIVESIPMGMHIYELESDDRLVFTAANPAATEILRVDNDQFVGKTIEDAFPPLADTEIPDRYRAAAASGQAWQTDQIDYEQGQIKGAFEVHAFQTSPGRMVAAFLDVTERRQAEQALRESEEKYRTLVEQSLQGIITVQDYRIVFANAAFADISGYTVEELLSLEPEAVQALMHPEDRPAIWSRFRDRLLGKAMDPRFTYRAIRKDGTVQWLDQAANRIEYRGKPAIQATIVDITEQVQAEQERTRLLAQVQEQAQRVAQIVDAVPEGVLLLDADRRVVLANPLARRELTVLSGAAVGDTLTYLGDRSLDELLTSPPKGLWHDVATDGRSFQVIARPLETGPTPGEWVMVIRDVTQQREIEQRVQQQERLASVGQLAAGIAHDFNNVMATIVLYAQMTARMDGLPDVVHRRMETINQQSAHATNLIQQILDFSRRSVLERRPLDLLPLFKEHVSILGRTLPESIEIRLAYGPGDYWVNADPTRMRQMVTNLALNARDAMLGGGELSIELEQIEVRPGESPILPEMDAGDWVCMTVSDTGMGIPSDVLPHIFEPFFTTKAPLGSGLGLSQVYGIVGRHGGRIDVQTQVGAGTTFTVYLPIHPIKPSGEAEFGKVEAVHLGQGETILVVEDDNTVRKALVETLTLLNYRLLEATNGQEALVVLEQHGDEVDLVLSDVVMPGMGGMALLHALGSRGIKVPLIMLTGHPLEREMEDLRAQGMSDWLPKPPRLEQLAEAIARALAQE